MYIVYNDVIEYRSILAVHDVPLTGTTPHHLSGSHSSEPSPTFWHTWGEDFGLLSFFTLSPSSLHFRVISNTHLFRSLLFQASNTKRNQPQPEHALARPSAWMMRDLEAGPNSVCVPATTSVVTGRCPHPSYQFRTYPRHMYPHHGPRSRFHCTSLSDTTSVQYRWPCR